MKHKKRPFFQLRMKGIDPNIWTITQISYLEPDTERYTVTIEKSDDDYERDY